MAGVWLSGDSLWEQMALDSTIVTRLTCPSLRFLICKGGGDDQTCTSGCRENERGWCTAKRFDSMLSRGLCSVTHFRSCLERGRALLLAQRDLSANPGPPSRGAADIPFLRWALSLPEAWAGCRDPKAAGLEASFRHGPRGMF